MNTIQSILNKQVLYEDKLNKIKIIQCICLNLEVVISSSSWSDVMDVPAPTRSVEIDSQSDRSSVSKTDYQAALCWKISQICLDQHVTSNKEFGISLYCY